MVMSTAIRVRSFAVRLSISLLWSDSTVAAWVSTLLAAEERMEAPRVADCSEEAEAAVAALEAEKAAGKHSQETLATVLDAIVVARKRLKTAKAVLRMCNDAQQNLEDRITSQVLAQTSSGILF